MESSDAMVRWTDQMKGEWDRTLTPFDQFMQTLVARYADPQPGGVGKFWRLFPVEHAVAHGLWLVMTKVAKKFHLEMRTPRDVSEQIAPRTDRLVNAGLVFAYADPNMAADAFYHAVMEPTERELIRAAKPDVLENAFDVRAGAFFLDLIKRVLNRVQELEHLLSAYRKVTDEPAYQLQGKQSAPETVAWVESWTAYTIRRDLASLIRTADIGLADEWKPSNGMYDVSSTLLYGKQQLREAICFAQAIRHLPVAFGRVPAEVRMADSKVETSWINTQLLLAAAHAPDQEHLNGDQFLRAHACLMEQGTGGVVERFRQRMIRRNPAYADWHRYLEGMLNERVRSIVEHGAISINPETMLAVYLLADPTTIVVHSMEAIQIACGNSTVLDEQHMDAATIARQIAWHKVDAEEFRGIVGGGELSPAMIADGVLQMPERLRREAVADALEHEQWKAFLDAFLERGLAEVDEFLVERHESETSPAHLFVWLRRMIARQATALASPTHDAEDMEEQTTQLVVRALARLSKKNLAALLGDKRTRVRWASCFRTYFTPLMDNERQEEYTALRKRIPVTLWRSYVFSAELLAREEAYAAAAQGLKREKISLYHAWGNVGANDCVLIDFPRLLGCSRAQAARLMKRQTDEDTFLWLHQGEKNPARLLKTYRQNRETYFAMMTSEREVATKKRDARK